MEEPQIYDVASSGQLDLFPEQLSLYDSGILYAATKPVELAAL